jgi:opacity protein-like surface antigen
MQCLHPRRKVISMKRYTCCVVALAGLLILAASAYAETSYRFELYGAGNLPIDEKFVIGLPQFEVPIQGEHQFSFGARGGLRVGADGSGRWGQDILYSYGTNAAKIAVHSNGDFAYMQRTHQFAYNAVFYPGGLSGSKKVFPYLTAGAGGIIFTLSQKAIRDAMDKGLGQLQTHTTFAFNVGGGVRYQFTDHCGIRFDVRDWMSHPPRYGIVAESTNPDTFVFPVNGVFQQVEFSIGLVFSTKSNK